MAKKARKKSAAKGRKKSKASPKKSVTKKKSKVGAAAQKKKTARRAKRKTIGDRLSNAYRTVVDTVTGTDRLRNKLEKPGTSETE